MIKHRSLHCVPQRKASERWGMRIKRGEHFNGNNGNHPTNTTAHAAFTGLFMGLQSQSCLLCPTVSYHYIQKQQMNSSQWRNKLPHCNGVVVLPVIRLLKPIIIWGGGHWNRLGIPYPQANRPEVVADLHCFCHSSRKSRLKADSPWAIVERAKAENYRLSGKSWKIRPRERKK